jgi:hypothetical protein
LQRKIFFNFNFLKKMLKNQEPNGEVTPNVTPNGEATPNVNAPKTFTQAEVDAMLAAQKPAVAAPVSQTEDELLEKLAAKKQEKRDAVIEKYAAQQNVLGEQISALAQASQIANAQRGKIQFAILDEKGTVTKLPAFDFNRPDAHENDAEGKMGGAVLGIALRYLNIERVTLEAAERDELASIA